MLNSKSELNKCHIPRLVVEVEDEEKTKERKEQEQREEDEMTSLLGDMELDWETRKLGRGSWIRRRGG